MRPIVLTPRRSSRFSGPLALLLFAVLLLGGLSSELAAQPAAATDPPSAELSRPFDPAAATDAYLARLSPEAKARSDAYFEGGYWLQLWGFLYGLGVAWLFLGTGLSVRMRDLVERLSRFRFLQTLLYGAGYILLTALLSLPLTLYQGFFREHQYNLSNQTFGAWLWDQGKGLLLGMVFGSLLIAALYAVVRKLPRAWWVAATAVMGAFLAVALILAPVYINPLFNEYTRLEDPQVRDPILRLAQASGIPAHDVWVSDASKQSNRVSANVAGFLGTERITLNDNLLSRCTLPEIEAVMGHEMGHYVLGHMGELFWQLLLVQGLGLAFLAWAFRRVQEPWGRSWGLRGIADPAGLPLLAALFSAYFFFLTPVTNTLIRTNEVEADQYGLDAARQPDGFAEVALKLGDYRKLSPGPIEEMIFFDHPSGRNRIQMAMRWKAEHLTESAP